MGKAKEIAELGDKITVSGGTVTVADINTSTFSGTSIHSMQDVDLTGIAHNMFLKYNLSNTQFEVVAGNTSSIDEGTNLYYTDARADARAQLKIDALVDSSPGTLDTLNELAAALGDDANFSTTVTNSIATKLPLAGGTLTGNLIIDPSAAGAAVLGLERIGAANQWKIAQGHTATDYLEILEGSSTRLTIKNGGNVGIGTTNPSDKLHVNGTVKVQGAITSALTSSGGTFLSISHSGNENWSFDAKSGSGSTDYVDFGIAGGTRCMTWQEDGNVGVGTSSPNTRLTVGDGSGTEVLTILAGTTGESQLRFADGTSGSAAYQGRVEYEHTNNILRLGAGGGTDVAIDANGNMDLTKDGANLKLYYNNAGQYSANLGWRHLQLGNNGANYIVAGNTSANGDLYFVVNNTNDLSTNNGSSHNGTVAMHIDSTGKVGIGTSSPLRKIHISDAGDTHLLLQSTNATNDYEIFEMGVGANSNSKVDLTFRTRNNSGTGGSEVMRLSNDGDVHLNSGVDVRIQLGTSGTGATSVSDNSVYVRGNDDDLILGAAGNGNIFFKENAATHMTIEPGGNVGIGITNPENALHVSSSANAQILVQSSSGGDASIKFNRSGQTFFMGIESSDNSFRISDTGNGVGDGDRFVIDASGQVGIGTTNPDNNQHGSIDPKLHVYGSENSGFGLVARFQSGTDANNSGSAILVNHGNDRGLLIEAGRDGRDYPNPPYFNGTGNPASSSAVISNDDGVAHLGILNSGGTNTRMLTLRQHSWIGDNKYNVGINQEYPVTKLEISDYKDGTGNNPNGIGLRLSSTAGSTGSNSANGGTGIEFAGHGHNYNGAGTGVAGSNPIAIRINPVYEYWGQNNSMSNYGQTYPYLKFDFKKSDNVNYITPLLVSGLGNGRVAIGNDTANVSHRLSLGSDAKSINYRVSGSGGHAIADGTYEENARSFSLGGSDTAFITEGTVSNSNKWRVRFEGDFGNNYQGGGLNLPAAQIYVTNTQPTVYIGSTNITVSRDSSTGKLKVTNQSGSYAVHFTGKITVWDHPQSNRPTFDSEMQAINLQGTDDYGTNLYGGLIMKTPVYSEYHFQWSGLQNHSLTFTCGSYQMSTMEYTSHQTNGGGNIHKYVRGKWGNNHTSHDWVEMDNNGSTWGLTTTFTATDQNGGSSGAHGKLVINETYGSGSVSTRTLVVKTYYGSWGLTFA